MQVYSTVELSTLKSPLINLRPGLLSTALHKASYSSRCLQICVRQNIDNGIASMAKFFFCLDPLKGLNLVWYSKGVPF